MWYNTLWTSQAIYPRSSGSFTSCSACGLSTGIFMKVISPLISKRRTIIKQLCVGMRFDLSIHIQICGALNNVNLYVGHLLLFFLFECIWSALWITCAKLIELDLPFSALAHPVPVLLHMLTIVTAWFELPGTAQHYDLMVFTFNHK